MGINKLRYLDYIGRVCHEAILAKRFSEGDNRGVGWDESSKGVKYLVRSCVLFVIDNKDTITPRMLHDNWKATKKSMGWEKGNTVCNDSKVHSSITEYENLTDSEKDKDSIFIDVALTMYHYLTK